MRQYRAYYEGTRYGPLAQIAAKVIPEFLERMVGRTFRISTMLVFSPEQVLVQWFEYNPDGSVSGFSEFFVPP